MHSMHVVNSQHMVDWCGGPRSIYIHIITHDRRVQISKHAQSHHENSSQSVEIRPELKIDLFQDVWPSGSSACKITEQRDQG